MPFTAAHFTRANAGAAVAPFSGVERHCERGKRVAARFSAVPGGGAPLVDVSVYETILVDVGSTRGTHPTTDASRNVSREAH